MHLSRGASLLEEVAAQTAHPGCRAIAVGPKDIEDAKALMLMHKEIDVDRVRRHVAALAALADKPNLSGLDAVIRLAAAGRPSAISAETQRDLSVSLERLGAVAV